MRDDASKVGYIPGRKPTGEWFAVEVYLVGGQWRNANGLVPPTEVIYSSESQAINAGERKAKK